MSDLNQRLRALYAEKMGQLEQILADQDGVSGPLLLAIPEGCSHTSLRLLIVGQQTNGWPEISTGIDTLMATYREFDFGRNYIASPFWQASHQLHAAVNPGGPPRSFLWSNLIKVDQYGERPHEHMEDRVAAIGLLEAEIAITEPLAVIFFKGPNYDTRMRKTFPGVEYRPLSAVVSQLVHPTLPLRPFRTYHPNYLWQAKKRDALDLISEKIREA